VAPVDLSRVCWRTSSWTTHGNCVEVAFVDQLVATRDSKAPDDAVLLFSDARWTSFVGAVKNDRFVG
jgi:hypothetical protein